MAAVGTQNDKDDLLAAAIAAGGTVKAAAASVGVSERTARRRMQDEAFKEKVNALRSLLLEEASAAMLARLSVAGECLEKLLKAESEQVRLGASRAIVMLALGLRQAAEIEGRIRSLEERQGKKDGDRLDSFRDEYAGGKGEDDGE